MIKRYFFTGLIVLFPVVVTILIVSFLINLLTKPFLNVVVGLFAQLGLLHKPFLFLSAEQVTHLISKALIIVTLVFVTIFAGLMAQIFAARYLIRLGDYFLHRIPIVNKIYKASQDVVKTVFAKDQQAFSQVVLVPFPHDKAYSIAMITNEPPQKDGNDAQEDLVSVFLPGTPNPTMGFMLLFRRKHLIFVDTKVDDAVKAIISCGVTITEFSPSQNKVDKNE